MGSTLIRFIKRYRIYFLVLALALAWKLLWLLLDSFPFNSDEAVVGLMAKHILAGEHPLFFYGQAYMGSLDAYLVALGFLIFGVQVWVIRLVQIVIYLLTIFVVLKICYLAFKNESIALAAGLLLAIPTVNVHLYTTVSLGGYGEALLIGSLVLYLWLKIRFKFATDNNIFKKAAFSIAIIGILAGLGIWANALSLVLIIPVMLDILITLLRNKLQPRKGLLLLILGLALIVGLFPFWIAAFRNGLIVYVKEMFGSAISVEVKGWFGRVFDHVRNFVLLGIPVIFGIRPPWGVIWLVLPMIPIVLLVWVFVFIRIRKVILEYKETRWLLWVCLGIIFTLAVGFLFTSFGIDPSGRYFVPLAIPLGIIFSIVVFFTIKKPTVRWILLGIVLVFNLSSTIQCGIKTPTGFTTQFYEPSIIDHSYDKELIDFLEVNNESRGYSNYWVTYPIAFLSNENVIFVPQLPYHLDQTYTWRDDRYGKYDDLVSQSIQVAYITTRNPGLDLRIVSSFTDNGITWKEKFIGDYHVYYHLNKRISPIDLKLIQVK